MKKPSTSEAKLLRDNADLRARLEEAEDTLRAIRAGEVDTLVIGEEIYSLQGAETPYRILIEAMNEGAATLVEDGTVLYCNQRLAEMLRTPLQDLIGSSLRRFLAPADLPAFDALLAKGKQGSGKGEFCLRSQNAPAVSVQFSFNVLDIDGARAVCVVATDLTERKRIEEALRQAQDTLERRVIERTQEALRANQALRENEERLRLILQASSMGTFEVNLLTGAGRWNATEFELLGLKLGDVPPGPESFFHFVHPEDVARLRAEWEEALRSGEFDAEFRIVRADGQVRWMAGRGQFIFENKAGSEASEFRGQALRFLGVNFDITGRKQNEEATRLALRDSEERQAEIAALLAGARKVLEHRQFQPAAHAVYHACKELVGATAGYVALLSEDETENEVLFLDSGARPCTVDPSLPMPIRGLRAEACRARRAVYQNGFAASAWTRMLPPGHVALDNALFAPLIVEGKTLGLFGLADKPGGFTDNDARVASAFADLAALALRNSRTLELLEHSEERFRSVAQTANDAIVTADAQGNVVFWNRAAEGIFGYRAEEVVGQPLVGIVPERLRSAHQQAFAHAFSRDHFGAVKKSFEVPGRKKDGTEIPIELSLAQWHSGEESFFTGIARDITERKHAEEALTRAHADLERTVEQRTAELRATNARLREEIEARQRKEKDLSEAELRYRTVADFTYDWEYWETPDGVLLYCSPSCERITGHAAAELVGDPGLLARMVYPEDQDNWQQHDREALTASDGATIVFRIQHKDGGIRWIDHNCRPVLGPRGESLGVRASNRDITARKQVEMEMQQLRQELARTSRITVAGQLTAALAHELAQPLGAILCNAQAAEQYLGQAQPPLSEVRDILSDIEADGERARNVIQRLRALFQKSDQQRTPVQLNTLVHETIELMHSEFVTKDASVELDLDPALPELLGDYVQLQQVVINLIFNALDAMAVQEPGTRRLHIRTDCTEPQSVRLSLRDSGTGLSAEQLSRLGEPFFTTKPTGMGMGLAISRSIMEAHGGRLWAENNPDRGATFYLALPVDSER